MHTAQVPGLKEQADPVVGMSAPKALETVPSWSVFLNPEAEL